MISRDSYFVRIVSHHRRMKPEAKISVFINRLVTLRKLDHIFHDTKCYLEESYTLIADK
jgi:hypothetical protein